MQPFSFKEAGVWGANHSVSVVECGWPRPVIGKGELPYEFDIPKDTGTRVALCKFLFESLSGDAVLIWYDDWSVWPSGEWMPMFDRFRQSFGVTESLKEVPAYFFEAKELDDALSFFIWASLFLWNCHVVSARQGQCIFLSHDEFGCTKFPVHGWQAGTRKRLTVEGQDL